MEEPQTEITCGHLSCGCPRPSTGNYCSEYCKNAHETGSPDVVCQCGHPDCLT